MNRFTLVFIAFFAFLSHSTAQVVKIDSSFSGDGQLTAFLHSPIMYAHPLDVLPNGNILAGGFDPVGYGLKVNIYSGQGDSLGRIGLLPGEEWKEGVSVVKVLPDGKFLCNNGGEELRRYRADGAIDSTFGINGFAPLQKVRVVDLAISPEGKIYGVGKYGYSDTAAVVAFLENGVPDSSFSDDGLLHYKQSEIEIFYCVELQEDGRLLVSGFSFFAHKNRPASLIRFHPDGQLDSTFGVNGRILERLTRQSEGYSLGVQPDQKIVMGGYTIPPYMASVLRYLPSGDRDIAFGDSGVVYLPIGFEVLDLNIRPDGKLLLFVWAPVHSNATGTMLVQLNPDGSMDQSFGSSGIFVCNTTPVDPPMAMVPSGNNKLVTASTTYLGQTSFRQLHIHQFILDFNVGVLNPPNRLSRAEVLIYPNPVSRNIQLQFELQTPEVLDIQLMDMNGRVLQTVHRRQQFGAGQHEVAIEISETLPAGTYLLQIRGQGMELLSVQWVKG